MTVRMKRIHLHWTAGRQMPEREALKAYHFLIGYENSSNSPSGGKAKVIDGDCKPEHNYKIRKGQQYAAHTAGANTGAIGVAVCGMLGAKEYPLSVGEHAYNYKQMLKMIALVAQLCYVYKVPITDKTVLTHAEVQTNLGIKQRNKWDICWLPEHDNRLMSPRHAGDLLRGCIEHEYRMHYDVKTPKLNLVERTHDWVTSWPSIY